ncbi:alpha-D-ribose 1-methylphosphonate 5-triphosphate diphosphatase [Pontivivens insulae]|uniref:Alpha-D-ribose 1-methylphosphonate 5-triphosphate diphosphatase n=1 Tax=Pontivivens insulae TaxID=1639689 RepID=A0A2R8AEW4_9RHOB|nr:alpha-D-ribose 1-methylphosphonate 5-triphosphate diphosphatase [Pontivivens insulae]RED11980.1 alpha-D-ribose 1-methylphosphonate 5-triphosphate diphosphatase [Pontivivens insulae]SPF30736.1 Alpha-D-ribose 1-methylphosphonate 5-triphosphate diphosphatase [Pontivivens insulae]
MTRALTFEGAKVLRPDGLTGGSVCVEGDQIVERGGRQVDLSGYLVLPGIIDLHGDGFERHLAPRRGALANPLAGLAALDAELGACGVTTAWLAQFWSWEGGMRAPAFAREMATALQNYPALADLRMQLRLETHLTDQMDEVAEFVRSSGIDYVVFNDNLPHRALEAGKVPPRLTGSALRSGRSPEQHLAIMQAAHARGAEVQAALGRFVSQLPGVTFGSHDDATAERRACFDDLGAKIAEFPMAAEAAVGTVVMGAPNVVRGRSQHRNLAAADAIASGACLALASDYHYPSLAQAAFKLMSGGMRLPEAWALVSAGPARLIGLADRGRIATGARADLVFVEEDTLRIRGTMAGGRWTWLQDDMMQRLLTVD